VSLEDVRSALSKANVDLPLGSLDDAQVSRTLVINGQLMDAPAYQQLILRQMNGVPVRLDAFGTAVAGWRTTGSPGGRGRGAPCWSSCSSRRPQTSSKP